MISEVIILGREEKYDNEESAERLRKWSVGKWNGVRKKNESSALLGAETWSLLLFFGTLLKLDTLKSV